MKSKDILEFEQVLGHRFSRGELLEQAFTHSSHAREKESARVSVSVPNDQQPPDRSADNEQLEFLGDAVLALTVSEELFRKFPDFREGDLSKLRAHLVSEKHLTRAAQQLEIGRYLRLGRGEEKSGGRDKAALLADALEAVLGALYLDAGLEECRKVILRFVISPELERLEREGTSLPLTDFKSTLQEKLQAAGLPQPSYVLAREQGPEHRKTF
ncbi:MAG TPA: ribonuclease III, partial [Terriglobia bacterium]|nr:ribonuclease III [Terriglobia bacterium]